MHQYFEKIKKKLTFNNLLLLVYMVITLTITLTHEPWRDEAQSWLIAKNLNIIDIIKQMKFEGHPCLWHLILVPFAKLNFSYKIVNVISWMIGCFATTMIVKKSNFSKIINVVIVLSTPILYYYTALGRSYCLVTFFIAWLMYLYPIRKDKPILYGVIVALLTNTHILVCGFVGILMLKDFLELFTIKENFKKRFVGFLLEVIGVILLFLQLFSSLTNNAENSNFINLTLFSPFGSFFSLMRVVVNDNLVLFVTLLLSFIGIFIALFKQKFIFLILLASTVFTVFVSTYVYKLGIQHLGILLIITLFCCYLSKKVEPNNKILEITLLVFFASTVPYSLSLTFKDLTGNFTNSRDISNYIADNIPKDTTFLCIADDKVLSLVPYLQDDYKFLSHYTEKEFTYITWSNERHQEKNYYNILAMMETQNTKYIIHSIGDNDYEVDMLKKNKVVKVLEVFDDENIIPTTFEKYEILEVIKE